MNEHTPGPWEATRSGRSFVIACGLEDGDRGYFADVWPGKTAEADAFLIAAAPELLEVARHALETLDEGHKNLRTVLRTAIDKAERGEVNGNGS